MDFHEDCPPWTGKPLLWEMCRQTQETLGQWGKWKSREEEASVKATLSSINPFHSHLAPHMTALICRVCQHDRSMHSKFPLHVEVLPAELWAMMSTACAIKQIWECCWSKFCTISLHLFEKWRWGSASNPHQIEYSLLSDVIAALTVCPRKKSQDYGGVSLTM